MSTPSGLLLLASGSGTRFGSDKRLALLPDGRHVLCATLATVSAAFDHWRLVLRAGRDEDLPGQLAVDPARVVWSTNAAAGMGSALADGMRAVDGGWSSVFVGLGDMPWLQLDTLLALTAAAAHLDTAGHPWILRPAHAGRFGHPVGFSRHFHGNLAALGGAAGARGVIEAAPHAVVVHDCPFDDILRDVDTPADLRLVDGDGAKPVAVADPNCYPG